MARVFLVFLCLVGFLISTYFTAIAYRWIGPDDGWVPSFCRLSQQTCARVVFTPRARILGLPNSVLGQVFYLAILAGIFTGMLFVGPLYYLFLSASLVTVGLGVYLSYSLLFWTRIPCKLCFTSHALNLIIFILLLCWSRVGGGPSESRGAWGMLPRKEATEVVSKNPIPAEIIHTRSLWNCSPLLPDGTLPATWKEGCDTDPPQIREPPSPV